MFGGLLISRTFRCSNPLLKHGCRQKNSNCKFHKQVAPHEVKPPPPAPPAPQRDPTALKSILKATAFTISVTGASFVGATIWQYENIRKHSHWYERTIKWKWDPGKRGDWRAELSTWWQEQSNGHKIFWPICFANVLVFAAWRVPQWMPSMARYFASSIASKSVCLPMLLSAFSHYSAVHLALNMFVLHSFSTSAVHILGVEQFLAVYLSGATISALASHLHRLAIGSTAMSLGASGAILTMIAVVCTQMPETQMQIIFLPMFAFSAGNAIKAVIAFDTAGMLLRWTLLDHAAHLGGALFGLWYCYQGHHYLWAKREAIMLAWRDWRERGE